MCSLQPPPVPPPSFRCRLSHLPLSFGPTASPQPGRAPCRPTPRAPSRPSRTVRSQLEPLPNLCLFAQRSPAHPLSLTLVCLQTSRRTPASARPPPARPARSTAPPRRPTRAPCRPCRALDWSDWLDWWEGWWARWPCGRVLSLSSSFSSFHLERFNFFLYSNCFPSLLSFVSTPLFPSLVCPLRPTRQALPRLTYWLTPRWMCFNRTRVATSRGTGWGGEGEADKLRKAVGTCEFTFPRTRKGG